MCAKYPSTMTYRWHENHTDVLHVVNRQQGRQEPALADGTTSRVAGTTGVRLHGLKREKHR